MSADSECMNGPEKFNNDNFREVVSKRTSCNRLYNRKKTDFDNLFLEKYVHIK